MRENMTSELAAPATGHDEENVTEDCFTYSPLDATRDGIRLVILKPSISHDLAESCRLEHVTFGEMPKYEALSYTWGSDAAHKVIRLNDKRFYIRDNLWDALAALQLPSEHRYLWIDAICINQEDIQERNQQVHIMPHIYSRAQTVLVWLGAMQIHPPSTSHTILMKWLCSVDYWRRVWIVQEIGKARQIKIHYGPHSMDWWDFIGRLREISHLEDCMPIKLSQQMLDRYGDGYKLENLLRTHQEALCTDVRDKIYGFTGLANDTYGRLVVDYGKTPFEIWKDVVRFRNENSAIPQHDIFQFASFTRDLLGGREMEVPEITESEELQCELRKDDTVICPARLWGRISCVGSSLDEMRSNLSKVDYWTASLRTHVFEQHLRGALEENDLLLQLLEHINSSDLISIRQYEGQVKKTFTLDIGYANRIMEVFCSKLSLPHSKPLNNTGDSIKEDYPDQNRCILLTCRDRGSVDQKVSKNFSGIGFATINTRVGDFICYFYLSAVAVIVRIEAGNIEVIGTAVVPDIHAMVAERAKNPGEVKPMFAVLNNAPLERSEAINIPLDFRTLYELLGDF